jgi:hypothetical protein
MVKPYHMALKHKRRGCDENTAAGYSAVDGCADRVSLPIVVKTAQQRTL